MRVAYLPPDWTASSLVLCQPQMQGNAFHFRKPGRVSDRLEVERGPRPRAPFTTSGAMSMSGSTTERLTDTQIDGLDG